MMLEINQETHFPILVVSQNTQVKSLAGAIAHALESHSIVELHAIGSYAVNQAIKAVALTRECFVTPNTERELSSIVMQPSFSQFDNKEKDTKKTKGNTITGLILTVGWY